MATKTKKRNRKRQKPHLADIIELLREITGCLVALSVVGLLWIVALRTPSDQLQDTVLSALIGLIGMIIGYTLGSKTHRERG
jgi:mannitol-specific phosphotransferase system IIBC component